MLAKDVDVNELAVETKNYSGAELEGLVRAAQSTAMNRHIKVWGQKIEEAIFCIISRCTKTKPIQSPAGNSAQLPKLQNFIQFN